MPRAIDPIALEESRTSLFFLKKRKLDAIRDRGGSLNLAYLDVHREHSRSNILINMLHMPYYDGVYIPCGSPNP